MLIVVPVVRGWEVGASGRRWGDRGGGEERARLGREEEWKASCSASEAEVKRDEEDEERGGDRAREGLASAGEAKGRGGGGALWACVEMRERLREGRERESVIEFDGAVDSNQPPNHPPTCLPLPEGTRETTPDDMAGGNPCAANVTMMHRQDSASLTAHLFVLLTPIRPDIDRGRRAPPPPKEGVGPLVRLLTGWKPPPPELLFIPSSTACFSS